ncbi:YggT family protein [Candidatus Saccharibacteria bacterium]|nr:MAG: YggT family protein [Candidatus Saccharibacteria bacterium]
MVQESQVEVTRESGIDEAGNDVQSQRVVRQEENAASNSGVARNVIWLVYGIVAGLHVIRFLLSLLGANGNNGFANLIYNITNPFVAPFRSLFSVDTTVGNGTGRFEIETLVALLVYGLIAWVLVRIVRIRKDTD